MCGEGVGVVTQATILSVLIFHECALLKKNLQYVEVNAIKSF